MPKLNKYFLFSKWIKFQIIRTQSTNSVIIFSSKPNLNFSQASLCSITFPFEITFLKGKILLIKISSKEVWMKKILSPLKRILKDKTFNFNTQNSWTVIKMPAKVGQSSNKTKFCSLKSTHAHEYSINKKFSSWTIDGIVQSQKAKNWHKIWNILPFISRVSLCLKKKALEIEKRNCL